MLRLPIPGVHALDHMTPRLTSLAHGGGCGCKLAPAVLQELLAGLPQAQAFPNLLVGSETADDAAVYRLTDELALVATTDFFTPIVDDPYEFGRIAATNALSDIYAMGGTPILALALLGMPLGKIGTDQVGQILAGGAAVCRAAGIPVAGGHSIDSAEPIYGLVALGTVHPGRVQRNAGARDGDVLILTKGLGVGVFSAALKQERLLAPGLSGHDRVDDAVEQRGAGGRGDGRRPCHDGRDGVRAAGPPAGDVPGRRAVGADALAGRAGAARRDGAGAGRRGHRGGGAGTGPATVRRSTRRAGCRTGSATSCATRRPAAAC